MPRAKPEDFIPLKANWFHILLTLAEGPRHGYAIMQEVADRTGGKVRLWPATLYGSIHRLEQAGLLEAFDDRRGNEPDDERRGDRRALHHRRGEDPDHERDERILRR